MCESKQRKFTQTTTEVKQTKQPRQVAGASMMLHKTMHNYRTRGLMNKCTYNKGVKTQRERANYIWRLIKTESLICIESLYLDF